MIDTKRRSRRLTRRASSRALVLVSACLLGMVASVARAHDFWLVPNAFRIATGATVTVRGQTSSLFPTSLSAVATDRVASARLIGRASSTPIRGLSTAGSSLVLQHRPARPGQYVVAVQLAPRAVRESPASFRRYLELEGAPEALARYEREGILPTDSITRRYAKYAKTFLEVGTGGPRAFAVAAGHPTEIMPLADPSRLRVGDTLRVRLTLRGAPVAGAHLHAGAVPPGHVREDTTAARAAAARDESVTADADGVAAIVVDRAGMWNVRSLHIVPAARGSGADWDVHWATIVFDVAAPAAAAQPRSKQSDSASVVETVTRYHRALETGDSTAALALLAPDVLILESGGVEDRAEYRNHHLPGDIAYARAVPSVRTVRRVVVEGTTAWVSGTSTSQGTYNGRAINSQGAESMVLTRQRDGRWLIRSIHWSSRARRSP